jgi:hypothetical protein
MAVAGAACSLWAIETGAPVLAAAFRGCSEPVRSHAAAIMAAAIINILLAIITPRQAEPARSQFVRFATTTGETGRVSMADDDRDDVEREHTTVVETGNGGGGGGGVLAVVLLIIVVLVLLFLFRGQLGLGGSKTSINVPDKIDVNVNHN